MMKLSEDNLMVAQLLNFQFKMATTAKNIHGSDTVDFTNNELKHCVVVTFVSRMISFH